MALNNRRRIKNSVFILSLDIRMLKISWTEKVTNREILSKMEMKKRLFTIIQIRKLKYFGHINKHNSMQTTLLNGRVSGKRGRGRPRT